MHRTFVPFMALLAGVLGFPGSTAMAQPSGGSTSVGYIDPAPLMNQVRFRFDAAYDNPTPDWAEFFYPKTGRLGGPGPEEPETSVNSQELNLYAEHVFAENLISGFFEIPLRMIDPEFNPHASGVSDLSAGARVSLYDDERQQLTFQFRTTVPTGDAGRGLGTDHVTLEPGMLYLRQLAPGTSLEAEFRNLIPIAGSDGWTGNILRYGVGIGHRLIEADRFYVTPVFEAVGWSVLEGKTFDPVLVAGRDLPSTVINLKFGTRIGSGSGDGASASGKSLYLGYGRAVTGQRWYEDVFRAEFRVLF